MSWAADLFSSRQWTTKIKDKILVSNMENWLSQLTLWMWLYSCQWGHITISSGPWPCCRASCSMWRSFGTRVPGCRAYRLVSPSFRSTNWAAGETRYQGRQLPQQSVKQRKRGQRKKKVTVLLREAAPGDGLETKEPSLQTNTEPAESSRHWQTHESGCERLHPQPHTHSNHSFHMVIWRILKISKLRL